MRNTCVRLLGTGILISVVCAFVFREPRYQGRTVSSWVEDFDVNDGEAYARAADAIRHIGPPAAPILLQQIRHRSAANSKFGQSLIKALQIERISPRASYLAKSDELQSKACNALMVLGPQARCVAPELAWMVANSDDVFALTVLNTMGWEGLKLVTNEVPRAGSTMRSRGVLIQFLGDLETRGAPAIPVLLSALKDPNVLVRRLAASALGSIRQNPLEVVPALMVALADTNALVRLSAATSLGLYEQRAASAVPALTRALQDADPVVQTEAAAALGNMRQEAAVSIPELVKLLDSQDVGVRIACGSALVQIGCTNLSAVAAARKMSRESNGTARCTGAVLVWKLEENQSDAANAVTECLKDLKGERIRAKTVRLLGWVGEDARIFAPELIKALRDPSVSVRASATNALKRIDPQFSTRAKQP